MTLTTLLTDEIIAVGSQVPTTNKAELFNTQTNQWTPVAGYPYGTGTTIIFLSISTSNLF